MTPVDPTVLALESQPLELTDCLCGSKSPFDWKKKKRKEKKHLSAQNGKAPGIRCDPCFQALVTFFGRALYRPVSQSQEGNCSSSYFSQELKEVQ